MRPRLLPRPLSRLLPVATTLALALGAVTGLTLVTTAPATAAAVILPVPTSNAGLGRIVTAPNGTLWFAERDANKVGMIVNGQIVKEIPFPVSSPGITTLPDLDVAPDSSLWVLYDSGRKVAHLDPQGNPLATGDLDEFGQSIRVAPDGTAWIVISFDEDYVVRISGNQITELPNSPECQDSLGRANDGSMWCRTSNGLTHLGASGGGVSYPANNFAAYPYAIAAGPVGDIWFGRYFGGTIGFSPDSGEVGYLNAATSQVVAFNTGERTAPFDLVRGPDNAMWFTSVGAAKGIGHVDAAGRGALTQIGGYAPRSLTFGTDGSLWFADSANNVVGRVSTAELQTTNVDPGAGSVFTVAAPGAAVGAASIPKVKKALPVAGGKVRLPVACSAAAACTGSLQLTTTKKVKTGKGPKAYVVLSKPVAYSVGAGATGKVKVKLNAKASRYLRRGRATTLRVQVGGATLGKIGVRRN